MGGVWAGDKADPKGPREDEATGGLRNCLAPEHERLNGKRKIRLDAYRPALWGGARLLCPSRAEVSFLGRIPRSASMLTRAVDRPHFKNNAGAPGYSPPALGPRSAVAADLGPGPGGLPAGPAGSAGLADPAKG